MAIFLLHLSETYKRKYMKKVALITGGSKGIGLEVARSLLSIGYKVCITGRSQESLTNAEGDLSAGSDLKTIAVDVRSYSDMVDAVTSVESDWGNIDVVIANAGIGHFAPIQELTIDQWNDTIDINLTGVFYTVKATMSSLKNTQGYLITIASLAGTNFFARGTAYNASKFGLVGFTQAAMLDLRHEGIKVSTIMPGSVSTYFGGRVPSDAEAWKIQPEDIGQMVLDLLAMPPRTLPSKIEVRPTRPPQK